MQKFTVTLADGDASRLVAIAKTHPALRVHQAHIAALRVGLRALGATPDLLTSELTLIAEERRSRAGQQVTS
jgi:hypothetical protein